MTSGAPLGLSLAVAHKYSNLVFHRSNTSYLFLPLLLQKESLPPSWHCRQSHHRHLYYSIKWNLFVARSGIPTTMMHSSVDFAAAYFEFPQLDKVHGEPSYTALKRLKKQLKANAITVVSDLGGGHYGHLGLVLTPAEYQLISNVPYERPVHPGPLVIPHRSTQAQIHVRTLIPI